LTQRIGFGRCIKMQRQSRDTGRNPIDRGSSSCR
jgi:hypothetical protein